MTGKELAEVPALSTPTDSEWKRAHDALMAAFSSVRVFYEWIDAPFGKVFLAKTDQGICRVSFRRPEDDLVDELERRELLPQRSSGHLDTVRRQFDEYFEGRRRSFDVAVDIRWGTPFQRKVLAAAAAIPFGRCERYTDVARRIGHPKAQRAVGNALGQNPVAIVVPCHRVVGSGGRLGGYTGGLDIKRSLMKIEGIDLEDPS